MFSMINREIFIFLKLRSLCPLSHPNNSNVCLTVCLTIHLSLSFLKIGSLLVFSDIVHDNRSPKYLVTEGVRFLKKKKKLAV